MNGFTFYIQKIHPWSQVADVDPHAIGGGERFHQATIEGIDASFTSFLQVCDQEIVADWVGKDQWRCCTGFVYVGILCTNQFPPSSITRRLPSTK